jgi:hypothetical protein
MSTIQSTADTSGSHIRHHHLSVLGFSSAGGAAVAQGVGPWPAGTQVLALVVQKIVEVGMDLTRLVREKIGETGGGGERVGEKQISGTGVDADRVGGIAPCAHVGAFGDEHPLSSGHREATTHDSTPKKSTYILEHAAIQIEKAQRTVPIWPTVEPLA